MKGIFAFSFLDRYGDVIISKGGQIPLMPASNMKILTGYAAYRILGRDYHFSTEFRREDDTVEVSGDPSPLLQGLDLNHIVQALSDGKPVRNVVFNSDRLDSRPYHPSWELEDRKFTYQAKITPFSVNEGSVPRGKGPFEVSSLSDPHGTQHKPARNPLKTFERSICSLSEDLAKKTDSLGNSDTALHAESISQVISHMETVSCNFSAEVLQKYLGHKTTKKKGSWKNGPQAVVDLLNKMGLDTDGIAVADGSGLSRMNLLKTDLLASLIHNISQSGDGDFLKLLPAPGSGTLSKRLAVVSQFGIHAKTGSIGHCASLTGYMEKPQVSFSIMINNSTEPGSVLTDRIDSFIENFIKRRLQI